MQAGHGFVLFWVGKRSPMLYLIETEDLKKMLVMHKNIIRYKIRNIPRSASHLRRSLEKYQRASLLLLLNRQILLFLLHPN